MTTKNQKYEAKQREAGKEKVTLWVPFGSEDDFRMMAEFCCQHRDYSPYMARSYKTGRMGKAV